MKSFWTFCAASLLLAGAAGAGRGEKPAPDELLNLVVSPRYAQWLVGPVARLATAEEIEAYLALTDDDEAKRFITEFWSRRPPLPDVPGLTSEQQYERRAEEADRRFTEVAFRGRHTDRGAIFIVYGEPKEIDWEVGRRQRELEVWRYGGDHPTGLDGQAPQRTYRFVKDGDLTRLARGSELPRVLP